MRHFIAFATVVGFLSLVDAGAGPPKKEEIPKLINVLKTSTNAKARAQAADDIGYRGALRASDVTNAIEPLITALKNDKDADVRRACAKALGRTGSQGDKCVEALVGALKDMSPVVKIAAAEALGQFGPEAKSALPALRELVAMKESKDDKKVSQAAALAAKSIQGLEKKK